jgi:hypothetical protein
MRFKSGIFVDEKSLTKDEALEFVAFLLDERERHIKHLKEFKQALTDDTKSDFYKIVAATVVVRDVDDVEHIDRTLDLLSKKFNLKVEYQTFK